MEALAANSAWMTPLETRLDDEKRLILDVDIKVGTRTFPVFLRYPANFPHTPPSVYPRGDESLWSNHQFGPGGELCLEHGPDTWTSDTAGARVLESAHRLLSKENPPSGKPQAVPSRHEVSVGQRFRTTHSRLFLTRDQSGFLAGVPVRTKLSAKVLLEFRSECTVYFIDKVDMPDGEPWHSAEIPRTLSGESFDRSASILRIHEQSALPPSADITEFKAAAIALGFEGTEPTVIILKGTSVHTYVVLDTAVLAVTTMPLEPEAQRLDEAHAALKSKSVAIVGCGSVGSKIATMLARSGVSDFYLIDDDLLLPGNLVRHDLDWRDIGMHKADAVAQKIKNVNPAAQVLVRRIRMAGQESSGSADAAMSSLTIRDLIVDATANANVFNLASALAVSARKPMVWALVYGGGFGGLVARYRPEIEPPPPIMRRAIENWFAEKNYKPKVVTRDYATGGDGPPLIADDADVTSIAAPAARMVIDTLIGRDPSHFPFSAYVVGLAQEAGLFTQAFETYPIEMPAPTPPEIAPELSQEEATVELQKIVQMILK